MIQVSKYHHLLHEYHVQTEGGLINQMSTKLKQHTLEKSDGRGFPILEVSSS